MQKTLTAALAIALLALCSACTPEQLYGSGQAYQRNRCLNMPTQEQQAQCMQAADKPYGDYRRETDAAGD